MDTFRIALDRLQRPDALDVECPECEARPEEECVVWLYGSPYRSETHEARQDRADEDAWEAQNEVTC